MGWTWIFGPLEALGSEHSHVLTNAAQVRALSPEQAGERVPVRMRGVVLQEGGDNLTLGDETAAIFLSAESIVFSELLRGDLVEVEGVSDPGKYAPIVRVTGCRKVGRSPIPPARRVTFDELLTGRWDAQWVEVTGVVRRVGPAVQDPGICEMWLATGGGQLPVSLSKEQGADLEVDSELCLRALCFYRFNLARQALSPVLSVPRGEIVVVRTPAPPDPSALPLRSIASLMQFDPEERYGHRVRLAGVVTHVEPGVAFWIHDGNRGARVHTRQEDSLTVGTGVEVLGFLSRGGYSPVLEDAVYRRSALEKFPIPNRLDQPVTALQHDSDLVELEGTIQEQWLALDGCRLRLVDGTNRFSALLSLAARSPVPRGWVPGSRVRVTGICMVNAGSPGVSAGTIAPQSFEILLRSPADLHVLQPPPWWTPEHIIWVLGTVIGTLLLVVLGFNWNHRRHMREQVLARAKSEAEFAAVWNERNRIARELHDTLAQGLGAISMQLEVVKRRLPTDSDARAALEEARTLARSNLAESRNAIWNMRSQVLETGDLPSAVRSILHSLTEGTSSKGEMLVRGRCRRLAPVTENNLLRICQEAITNAAKYANASRIEVVLEYGERRVDLSVLDNGCGFDPENPPASESGFGLVGMRERAAQLHGQLTVTSQPGEGTVLTLVLPLPGSCTL